MSIVVYSSDHRLVSLRQMHHFAKSMTWTQDQASAKLIFSRWRTENMINKILEGPVNPQTLDRFTLSHALCAENCGSALTHR